HCYDHPRELHSFPTRRSSDLGYQGALFGAAVGYGYFTPPLKFKDYVSTIRGGEGRPVFEHAHHLNVEANLTTRVHRRRRGAPGADRKSTRLNSSHVKISYAVF